MKRNLSLLMAASLFVFVGCEKFVPEDDITLIAPPLFSVSEGHQVRFAPGNLEYDGSYHFTVNQYDYGGYFGWGTGDHPMLTTVDWYDYTTFDDWGNHIGEGWRTLSADEWSYLIGGRADASAKCGAATVCDVHGMIILPDDWNGGTFNPGFYGWNTNVLDADSWSAMEKVGAVFLPAAGSRDGVAMSNIGSSGDYWSSTSYGVNDLYAEYVGFHGDTLAYDGLYCDRTYGISVRLVQDY